MSLVERKSVKQVSIASLVIDKPQSLSNVSLFSQQNFHAAEILSTLYAVFVRRRQAGAAEQPDGPNGPRLAGGCSANWSAAFRGSQRLVSGLDQLIDRPRDFCINLLTSQ